MCIRDSPKAHDRSSSALGVDGDDVEVRMVVEHHALVARGSFERFEGVARLRGGLVMLQVCGLVHALAQQRAKLAHVALEEPRPRRHEFAVADGIDGLDARSRALADVVEQTRSVDALLIVELMAGTRTQGERLQQFIDRGPKCAHVDERTKVPHTLHVLGTGDKGCREVDACVCLLYTSRCV